MCNGGNNGLPGMGGGESNVTALNEKLALQIMMGRSPMQVAWPPYPRAQPAQCSPATPCHAALVVARAPPFRRTPILRSTLSAACRRKEARPR